MKTRPITILFLLISFFVKSQIVNIPDANFKNALLNQSPSIDLNNDNEIQVSEANNYNFPIDVSNPDFEDMIFDFTGIEMFTNMTEFNAFGQLLYVGGFDFSFNTTLTAIDIGYCSVNSLNISNNNNLIELNISGVLINSLDVSHLLDLEVLIIRHTSFSNINLTQNINLKELSFFAGNINTIDLSNNLNLEILKTGGSPLSSLDVSNNINLKFLEMQSSNYSTIDLSQNINLEHIACSGSNVLNFDLSNNINLEVFGCGNNQFTSLDFSENVNLEIFASQGNENLEIINIKNGNNTNIVNFEALGSPNLTTVCVDNVNYAIDNFIFIDNSDVFSLCEDLSTLDNDYANDLKVYPIPMVNDIINIEANALIEIKELFFIDLAGRAIKINPENINEANNQISLKAEMINSEFFFLKIVTENGTIIKKIIK